MLRAMERPDRHCRAARAAIRLAPIIAVLLLALAPVVRAAGPPFPDPVDGQAVYDTAGLFEDETRFKAEGIIDAIEAQTKRRSSSIPRRSAETTSRPRRPRNMPGR
jgi:hypothetical protein